MLSKKNRLAQANILILMEWYDHQIRQGIGRYALKNNWHLTIDERSAIPEGWQGDGVLTVFDKRNDIADYVQQLDIPVVDMGLYHPEIQLPRVTGDNLDIGALAAEHFAERGYRHIAWFSRISNPIEQMRYEGFRERTLKLGLNEPLRWVWAENPSHPMDSWQGLSRWLESNLLAAPMPLAVFAFNDYDASNVLYVCRNANINVPEDVAILGIDNNELICLNQPVPISSIMHDLNRVGYEASRLLSRLIQGATPPAEPILIPPKGIQLRQSTDYTAIAIPAVRKAMTYMKENISRSIGINEIAEHAGVSRSTLDRLFLENFGRTVHTEVLRTRLNAVKHLLTTTNLPIHKIAEQTGFCHAQYLNNLFKRHEGITPKEFRKRYDRG
ncbi:MAG: DNA-binding transcriptional regulator [Kiritimatiellae bacterium]|nr:DNA-binding transcriptional regulator [Kiritimatiellia bacterium]